MDFKDLKSLEKYLQVKINNSLHTDVPKDVIKLENEHIESDVYAKYDPDLYIRRRENGGLLDENNYLIEPIENGVSITNVTTDDGYSENFSDYSTDSNTSIAPIIEYGEGYSWENSRIYQKPFERPFVNNTRIELQNGKAKEFLMKSLIKNGLNVE